MNLIGHNYIASKVLSRYNPLVAAGVYIPDLVPFLKSSVFTFEEIHENPDVVYQYCRKNDNECVDLALGMMTHSVKYGVDRYNKDIDEWLIGKDSKLGDEIAQKIVDCSGIPFETARGPRMHNYLWSGLDFYILSNFPEFAKQIQKAYSQVDIDKISKILSKAFKKDLNGVKGNLNDHIGLVNKNDITNPAGCISYWKDFLSQLSEQDNVNLEKAVSCISFISEKFDKNWPEIIDKTTKDVKFNMSMVII
jgi:hypothetical protein